GLWHQQPSNDPKITCSEDLATMIAQLASAHCHSSAHNPLNWLQDIANHVQTLLVEDELLISIVVRCQGIASKDVRINFLVKGTYPKPFFLLDSVRLKTGLGLTDIYKKEIKPSTSVRAISYRTFAEWHTIGCKFIAIACGGSIYSLVLIAGLGLRVAVASMVGTMHLNLANMLHSPPPNSPERKLIVEYIAPTITRMHLMSPLAMDTMFSPSLITRFAVSKSVDCTDLSVSDHFFDTIIQNNLFWTLNLWYMLIMKQGHKAPTDVQPWALEKEGMCTNHSQVIPYLSKDLHEHHHIYGTISKLYEELFEWMETYLQEEFELLMEVMSVLPGNFSPPVAPFVSLVININMCTKAHRDSLDRHLCLVIPIGHFEGGALWLLENGLV
ncbi:uncharacterized protein EDB91DRAFT_1029250, partial [Suillus paluster]|uniref:uncharacterized protein n=1 Tax=Suillus paluster TaxID=48578 RepID=UPI001B87D9D4